MVIGKGLLNDVGIYISEISKASRVLLVSDDNVYLFYGGGVKREPGGAGFAVGDMTGFAVAVYMRRIDFVQIPITLLLAADVSVGGKTAIDLEHGKNLVGVFWHPLLVLCDCNILQIPSRKQFENGMPEIIKYGITRLVELMKIDKKTKA